MCTKSSINKVEVKHLSDWLLPARASEQGNVIGLVSVYLYTVKYRVSAPGRSPTNLHIQHTGRLHS